MDWKALVSILVPIVLGSIPKVPKGLIPVITDGIQAAESFGSTGAQKKAQVMTIAQDALAGGHIIKPDANLKDADVLGAVDKGIDTAVHVVNILKDQQ